jgi:nicotinate dehydrogenase subunit B
VSRIPNEPAPTAAQGEVVFPGNLKANPRLSRWLRVQCEGLIEVMPGKVEIGQGILTTLAQIAADELDVDLARIRLVPATTAGSPNEGVTSGSLSVQDCGVAIRFVCAEARALFVQAAAERLGVPVEELGIEDGTISGPGNARTSYWELSGQVSLDRDASCRVAPKPVGDRKSTRLNSSHK